MPWCSGITTYPYPPSLALGGLRPLWFLLVALVILQLKTLVSCVSKLPHDVIKLVAEIVSAPKSDSLSLFQDGHSSNKCTLVSGEFLFQYRHRFERRSIVLKCRSRWPTHYASALIWLRSIIPLPNWGIQKLTNIDVLILSLRGAAHSRLCSRSWVAS